VKRLRGSHTVSPSALTPSCQRRSGDSLGLSATCPDEPCDSPTPMTRGASIRRLLPRTSTQVPTSRCVAIAVEKLAFLAVTAGVSASRRSPPRRWARSFLFVLRTAPVERFLLGRAPSGRTFDTPVTPSNRTRARIPAEDRASPLENAEAASCPAVVKRRALVDPGCLPSCQKPATQIDSPFNRY